MTSSSRRSGWGCWRRYLMTRGRSGGRVVGWWLDMTADDQRPVRWEGGWGWGLEAIFGDQRPVR